MKISLPSVSYSGIWGAQCCLPLDKIITKTAEFGYDGIEIVAKRHGATIGCPITTGIFIGIAARAAEEMVTEGKQNTTPYWRTLKSKGELNEKYPGGVEAQAAHLREEGHIIEPGKGKKPPQVKDFEKALVGV